MKFLRLVVLTTLFAGLSSIAPTMAEVPPTDKPTVPPQAEKGIDTANHAQNSNGESRNHGRNTDVHLPGSLEDLNKTLSPATPEDNHPSQGTDRNNGQNAVNVLGHVGQSLMDKLPEKAQGDESVEKAKEEIEQKIEERNSDAVGHNTDPLIHPDDNSGKGEDKNNGQNATQVLDHVATQLGDKLPGQSAGAQAVQNAQNNVMNQNPNGGGDTTVTPPVHHDDQSEHPSQSQGTDRNNGQNAVNVLGHVGQSLMDKLPEKAQGDESVEKAKEEIEQKIEERNSDDVDETPRGGANDVGENHRDTEKNHQVIKEGNEELKQDSAEIQQDRQQLRQNREELKQAYVKLREDRKAGADLTQDRQVIQSLREKIRSDKAELKKDSRELWEHYRNLRKNRKELWHERNWPPRPMHHHAGENRQ